MHVTFHWRVLVNTLPDSTLTTCTRQPQQPRLSEVHWGFECTGDLHRALTVFPAETIEGVYLKVIAKGREWPKGELLSGLPHPVRANRCFLMRLN